MQILHISTISMLSFSMYTVALPAPRPEATTGSGADVLGLQTLLSTDKNLAAVTEPKGLESNKSTEEKKEEGNTPLAVGPNELSKKKDPLAAGLGSVKTPAVPGEIPEQCRQYVTGAEKGGHEKGGEGKGGAGKGGHEKGGEGKGGEGKGGEGKGGEGKGGEGKGGEGKGGEGKGGEGKGGEGKGGEGKGGAGKGGAEKGGAGKTTEPPKITPPVHEAPKKSPKEPPTKTSSAVSSQIQGTQAVFTTALSSSVLVYAIAAVFL